MGTLVINPLMGTGYYSATSNNMELVHWGLMGVTFGTARRGLGGGPKDGFSLR